MWYTCKNIYTVLTKVLKKVVGILFTLGYAEEYHR
jgi:hypothetical protein